MKQKTKNKYPSVSRINDAQRVRLVKEIFATITGKYDFLNHFLSAGQDIYWRRYAARRMTFSRTRRYLDVATGTGDLGIAAAYHHPGVRVVGLDFVHEMLDAAAGKIRQQNLKPRIALLRGDALRLPFPDGSFDAAGIAFGIRNIPDKHGAFKEMLRIVVPGGQILILEMTFPQLPLIKRMYAPYLTRLLPALARAFSPNPHAYRYLADSILDFPSPDRFVESMEGAGMVGVSRHPLTLGITHLFIGHKPGTG
jgi:demethylmenaquinone methyltransferase/2-methoxy-6-polyprenyl-1,4-benzoquinol methylase